MLKTIFGKLIAIFICILIVGFSITGGVLYFFLSDFVINEKVQVLSQSADDINANFNAYLASIEEAQKNEDELYQNYAIELANTTFDGMMSLYSAYSNSYIWIVGEDGHIYKSVPELPNKIKLAISDDKGNMKLMDERQYKKVMTDGNEIVKEIGTFYGFFKPDLFQAKGNSWLTIEKPFKYTINNGSKEITTAVYLHTPVPEIQRARTAVLSFFLKAVAIAVLISSVMIYIFSRRLTKPLREMKQAAKVIAGGDFGKRLTVVNHDEIGDLAKSFNQMVTALENLEEMRRGFIANVSHELRTPMTTIRGFVEGILDGTIPSERQSYYLKIVRDEANRLSKLVNDLLDLAKMEAGELKLNMKDFDINELIRKSIIKLETLIVEKNLEVEAHFEEEELMVNADPDSIDRVVINLMHNSIKFTPEGGKITITTSIAKGLAVISIADTGIGIDQSEIDLVWDRFYKSDKSRSRDKMGTGLGLAIIKNIINEHKQEISVESEPGNGTKFIFSLNLMQN